MELTGNNNEERIWNYLVGKGLSKAGAAGLMGNLYAESALNPQNLQNSYEKKLGHTDSSYTAAVDNGSYKNFVRDSAGYGLAQWTYWSRKQNMLEFARAAGKSIGNLKMQLDFLFKELNEGYKSVLTVLKTATTVKAASDSVLLNYERPADQSNAVKAKRAGYGQTYYDKYAGTTSQLGNGGKALNIVEKFLTKNPCYKAGQKITVKGLMLHCVGCNQPSAMAFVNSWNSASYDRACVHAFIDGNDGTVYQTLPWEHRGWHGGGSSNNTHIGVEMCEPACIKYTSGAKFTCSDTATAKAVAKRTYEAAVQLFAYLCKKYNLNPTADGVIVSHKEGHTRGIASNHGDPEHLWTQLGMGYTMNGFRQAVKAAMDGVANAGTPTTPEQPTTPTGNTTTYPTTPFTVKVLISDLNIRNGAGMNYATTGKYTGKGVFTITEVKDGWGKLKSGAGWIYLENPKYCTVQTTAAKVALKVGDIVNFKGTKHYTSADAATGPACKPGKAKITRIYQLGKSKHPYHLVAVNGGGSTVYGWVDAADITGKA